MANYREVLIKIVHFTDEQVKFKKRINAPFDGPKKISELTDDEYFRLDEFVADYFQVYGIEENDDINDAGAMCESIIDVLSE